MAGYMVKFSDALISWRSKIKETVSRRSTKVEFKSMASCNVQNNLVSRLVQGD